MEAPFYVGQKVVCILQADFIGLKVGDTYTVLRLSKCHHHSIDIGLRESTVCSFCHGELGGCFINTRFFAAVEEFEYRDVTKQLAKLPTDEIPDVKHIKELVN